MIPSSRRRDLKGTTGHFEAPLQKPVPLPPQIPFDQCSSAFAVDVSGSTYGIVLEQEISAIKTISENLPSTTKSLCSIIPWDDQVYESLHLDQVDVLEDGGGTCPDALLADDQSRELLQKSHLWFLLTDGDITSDRVEAFAKAINAHKLHGKACVLVIFGYRPSTPIGCNISVGISAFAVVPDCIFLFHDVESRELFVLQTKGCFNAMNSAKHRNLILDEHTVWEDLPLASYESLFTIQVPQPLELKRSEIILQNRQQIDLEKLCSDDTDPEDSNAILNDDENLRTFLLTMSSRGRLAEARDWLSREKANTNDVSRLPRTDVLGTAMQVVKELVPIVRDQGLTRDGGRVHNSGSFTVRSAIIQARVDKLQIKLRLAYERNWEDLGRSVHAREKKTMERNSTLDDGLARLSMVERNGLEYPVSMSPVGRRRKAEHIRPGHELPKLTTYIPGYQLEESPFSAIPRPCPLCNGTAVSYAILLKACPSGPPTPGFPSRGSRSEILFPLAVSGFRETDVVSQFVCCDVCAFHLISYGLSPFNEDVKAALPVLPSLYNKNNRKTWLDAVDGFFEERFERRNLVSIMLAILSGAYDTFAADAETDNTLLCAVLQDACTQISAECFISQGPGQFSSMTQAMKFYFRKGTVDIRNELLQHPVESFTLLLRYTPGVYMVLENINLEMRTRALFLRLVVHVLEHHFQSRDTAGGRTALDYLNQLKEWESARQEHRNGSPRLIANSGQSNRKNAVAIDTLKAYNVVDGAVLDCFSSLGPVWEALQETCLVALHVCLCALADEPLTDKIVLKVLERWDGRNDLHTVFVAPEKVDDDFLASLKQGN